MRAPSVKDLLPSKRTKRATFEVIFLSGGNRHKVSKNLTPQSAITKGCLNEATLYLLFLSFEICFRIPVEIFVFVHPCRESFCHLVSIVVEVFAVERFADIDPDLAAVEAVQRMRLLGSSGPDLISSGDIDGDHGNACLDGEVCGAVLHLGEFACVGSCAFREDEADISVLGGLTCRGLSQDLMLRGSTST